MVSSSTQRGDLLAGRYRIEVFIAQGGQATVFRAMDTATGLPVAAKIATGDEETIECSSRRFAHSMNLRVNSPYVVSPIDIGEHDGRPFLIMVLLAGATVAEWIVLDGAPLSPSRIVRAVICLAYGLRDIHLAGFVHCDAKPANLMTDHDHRIVIGDMETALPIGTSIPASGKSFGTPTYLAPEQDGRGGVMTARTDVHAMGATIEDLLGLRTPEQHGRAVPQDGAGRLVKTLRSAASERPEDRPATPTILGKRVLASGAPLWAGQSFHTDKNATPTIACLACGAALSGWPDQCKACGAALPADASVLLFDHGPLAGRAFMVPEGEFYIGRYQLDAAVKQISRRHLRVVGDAGQPIVANAGATNPATLGGRVIDQALRVREPAELNLCGSHGLLLP